MRQSRCRVTRSNLRPKVRIRSCCSKDRSSISHDVNAFPLLPRETNGLASATDASIQQLSKINTHTTIITSSSSSRKLLVENKAIEKFNYKTQEACSKQSKTFSIKYVYGLCKKLLELIKSSLSLFFLQELQNSSAKKTRQNFFSKKLGVCKMCTGESSSPVCE